MTTGFIWGINYIKKAATGVMEFLLTRIISWYPSTVAMELMQK